MCDRAVWEERKVESGRAGLGRGGGCARQDLLLPLAWQSVAIACKHETWPWCLLVKVGSLVRLWGPGVQPAGPMWRREPKGTVGGPCRLLVPTPAPAPCLYLHLKRLLRHESGLVPRELLGSLSWGPGG